jgi:hypothetical protein
MGIKSHMSKNFGQVKQGLDGALENSDVSFGGGIGLAVEGLATVWDTSSRMKNGEGFGSALGKAVLENVKYGVAPYLIAADVGAPIIESYPGINRAAEQKKAFNQNYNFMGGGYPDTQTNYANRARGLESIKRNRQQITSDLGNEARRYHR